MSITEEINRMVQVAQEKHKLTPYDINNGLCEAFAQELQETLGLSYDDVVCTENFIEFGELPGHCWVWSGDRHYDAECPQGVTDWKELPIFKKYLSLHKENIEAKKDE